jgi:predicted short-subunit dehydrogenase-like oxidoreductase (DUF2520 family)
VSIIGAGNVSYGLAAALSKHFKLDYIFSRSPGPAIKLAKRVKAKYSKELNEVLKSDTVIIAVTDDSIVQVANAISPLNKKHKLILHTSGTVSSEVLAQCSLNYGVLYPLQTFTKGRKIDLKKVPMCILGSNGKSLKNIHFIASQLSEEVLYMSDEERQSIHLPAVMVNNFINHILYQVEKIVESSDLDIKLFYPLLQETLNKFKLDGAFNSQTGPARRRDLKTIEKHLNLLVEEADMKRIYQAITESIINTYHEDNRGD